jgi:hypothetical protein
MWLREINDTARALSLLCSVTSSYLALKGQYVASLKQDYDKQCDAHALARAKAAKARQVLVLDFQANLITLGSVFTPIEALRTLVIDKIGSNRAALFVVDLIRAVHGAELAIQQRNELVISWRGLNSEPLALMYFGIASEAGHTDTRYRDLVEGIYNQVDDAIYFSLALAGILQSHGERFRQRFGKEAPTLPVADFGERAQLIPDSMKYEGFERQLKAWAAADQKVKESKWRRAMRYFNAV